MLWQGRCSNFSLSHDFARRLNQRIIGFMCGNSQKIFDSPWHFSSKDIIFLVVMGKFTDALDYILHCCLFLNHETCRDHTYKISGRRQNNLPVSTRKDVLYRSLMSTTTTGRTYTLIFLAVSSEIANRRKKGKKKKNSTKETIAKPFMLHAYAMNLFFISYGIN